MIRPQLEVKPSAAAVDTDVVLVFQDGGKKPASPKGPYGKAVEKFRRNGAFSGRAGATQFIRFGGKGKAENVLLVGMGQPGELTEEKARVAGAHAFSKLAHEKSGKVALRLDGLKDAKGLEGDPARLARAFGEGIILSAYEFTKYKSKKSEEKYAGPARVTLITADKSIKSELDRHVAEIQALGEAVTITRDWSNEPSNYGTPEYFAGECQKLAKEYGLKCTVLSEKDAEKEKMGLFLGVGQGSVREGKIVVLEYNPKNAENAKTIAFVGKGITFDSGGISIKPSMRMEEMKHDMTGASTLVGAMLTAVRWKAKNRIVTVLAFTENMPDGDAIQPGNVLTSRSGKTVEVFNTDAEGRLVLGDVLDYAQDYKPDAVINAATLTGAVSVALGKQCCAIFGNDDGLIEQIRAAGDVSGERLWQLPLYDEYFDDLKSDIADMKNVANDGNGGAIRGGIFLKQFIRKGVKWAHLDIAAVAWGMGHLPYYPKKGASGAYVRTLAQFAADF